MCPPTSGRATIFFWLQNVSQKYHTAMIFFELHNVNQFHIRIKSRLHRDSLGIHRDS